MKNKRDFITLLDFSPEELNSLVTRGIELKTELKTGQINSSLQKKTLAMIFTLSSTRTRVGFETGMVQMGGHAIYLSPNDSQFGRGEPISDMAKVLSEMVDAVVIRTLSQSDIEAFAEAASIPVINAMSSQWHPCQLLADVQTFVEQRGSIVGRTVAFIGDGYNMCNSYINAARQWGFHLKMACPPGHEPDPQLIAKSNNAELVSTPEEAVSDADLVVTDVWSSMGHEEHVDARRKTFAGYQVNANLLDMAPKETLFMHCLPAHRGEEVDEQVLDDPRSVVWQEAGNRLHSQKALLEFLLASK